MKIATKVLANSDGSCKLNFMDCSVVASVHGPSPDISFTQISSEETYLRVFVNQPQSSSDLAFERSLETLLKRLIRITTELSMFPRTKLNISVLLVSMKSNNLNALRACAINAVFFALVDAGIPLNSLPLAVSDEQTICVVTKNVIDKGKKAIIYAETTENEKLDSFLTLFPPLRQQVESQFKQLFF